MSDWISHGVDFGTAVELIALVACVVLCGYTSRAAEWEARLISPFLRLSQRFALAVAACVAAPLVLRALLWPDLKFPLPLIVDEFSYLLAADTFAHGRVTNPTHPLWQFFETFHVIQVPTYASKYPPLQGLVMAAGQALLGHPWWGVYASVGAMSGAIFWALAGWVPRRWAMLGAFVALVQWEVLSYWMNSYWGGALAATGGALMLGAYPRLRASIQRRSPWIALAMAAGAGILANTRPYEGLVFAAPLTLAAAWRVFRGKRRARSLFTLAPACLLLAATGSAMLYYNWRVTGHMLEMPYVEHERQYVIAPVVMFLPLNPEPAYRHPVIAAYWKDDASLRARQDGPIVLFANHVYVLVIFFMGPAFLAACAGLWLLRCARITRWLLALLGFNLLAFFSIAWEMPHYAAPMTSLILLLEIQGLRALRRADAPAWGPSFTRAAVLACVIRFAACPLTGAAVHTLGLDPSNSIWRCCANRVDFGRASVVDQLSKLAGRHLVFVSYGSDQRNFHEYVYNLADIDSQKIVWARSMSRWEDLQLRDYYKDRTAWMLTVDRGQSTLTPLQ